MVNRPFCSILAALWVLAPESESAPLFSSSMILNLEPFFCIEPFEVGPSTFPSPPDPAAAAAVSIAAASAFNSSKLKFHMLTPCLYAA